MYKEEFTPDEVIRIKDLCYRSKRGGYISPDDSNFIDEMYHRDPEEYAKIQQEAADKAVSDYTGSFGG